MKRKLAALTLLLIMTALPARALAAELPLPKEGVYTFAWISDPQHYSARYPFLYSSMTAYLNNRKQALNLQYVVCTGDLVNDYDDERQWEVADASFHTLKNIPYGVLAGNHDFRVGAEDGSALYKKYFGSRRFEDFACYADSFEDNRGHVDLIDAGETKFVFVYMSYRLDDAAIDYMIKSLEAYPDRLGVLCLHDYVDGDMELTRDGRRVFERVLPLAPNLRYVLCGHEYGVGLREDTVQNGDGTSRTVYTMLQNYQAASRGGEGYFRLLYVDEKADTITVRTYSAAKNDENYFDTPGRRGLDKNYTFDTALESFTLPLCR